VFALENRDPFSEANVISRGIVGDLAGQLVVTSPVYKQHFNLRSGRCLEDESVSLRTWPCGVLDGRVWVESLQQQTSRGVPGRRRLVVVGNGMAAMRTVEQLLEQAPDAYEITIFGAEPRGNYNRILLSPLLAGDTDWAQIMLHPLEWYRERGITLHTGDPVVSIDRRRKRVISAAGDLGPPIANLPKVEARGQGGLLDAALSPSFPSDRTIYWSFAEPRTGGNATSVGKGVLSQDGKNLDQVKVIFHAMPTYDGDKHFGSRLAFGPDGKLYVTLGERSDKQMRPQAQRLDSDMGKIQRTSA